MNKRPSPLFSTGLTLVAIMAGLAFYVLSIGPVVWAYGEFPETRIAQAVYSPVLWVGHRSPAFYDWLDDYASWWQRL